MIDERNMSALQRALRIPGNASVYKTLTEMLKNRHATAFVGAGASCPLYPAWSELIAALAHEPVRLGLAAEEDKHFWIENARSKPSHVAFQIRVKLGESL